MKSTHALRFAVLAAMAALAPTLAAQSGQPPTSSEQNKLIKQFFELDSRSAEDRKQQCEILASLDTLPPLTASSAKSWHKKLQKAFAKGRKLEGKSGSFHYWEKEKKGFFLVGGKVTKKPKGLAIIMHGGGAGAGDAGSARGMFDTAAKQLGWLAIYPEVLEKTEHGWTDSGTEEWVLDLIAAARRTWKIDPDRIYLTGHSMGGYGTWMLGSRHADLVAALAPSAGGPTPIMDANTHEVIDVIEGIIPCLRNVRLAIYQSADDPQVRPEPNRVAAKKLAEAKERWGGFDYEYWEVDGRGHDAPPGGAIKLLEKIAATPRDPRPTKIVWQPSEMWVRQFYWLHWENPVPKAIVVAEVDRAANKITVTCDRSTNGLQVLLDERLVDIDQEVVVELNGSEVYRAIPQRTLSTMLLTAERGDPELMFAVRVL